jgi:tripartite-type tricarboxylate transporter receptor subunit TctC
MVRYVALLLVLGTRLGGERASAQRQPWPAKPVRIVNTFAAGGPVP